jgi:hypothetical protein
MIRSAHKTFPICLKRESYCDNVDVRRGLAVNFRVPVYTGALCMCLYVYKHFRVCMFWRLFVEARIHTCTHAHTRTHACNNSECDGETAHTNIQSKIIIIQEFLSLIVFVYVRVYVCMYQFPSIYNQNMLHTHQPYNDS